MEETALQKALQSADLFVLACREIDNNLQVTLLLDEDQNNATRQAAIKQALTDAGFTFDVVIFRYIPVTMPPRRKD